MSGGLDHNSDFQFAAQIGQSPPETWQMAPREVLVLLLDDLDLDMVCPLTSLCICAMACAHSYTNMCAHIHKNVNKCILNASQPATNLSRLLPQVLELLAHLWLPSALQAFLFVHHNRKIRDF